MGNFDDRINIVRAETLEYFRKAVYGSYDGYTSYKYLEGADKWRLFTELTPDLIVTYTIKKGTAEETVFLAERAQVGAWSGRKRVDVVFPANTSASDVTDLEVAIQIILKDLDGYHADTTGSEHYQQHSQAIRYILESLDGYGSSVDLSGMVNTELEHYVQHSDVFQTIRKDLDGYASDQTVSEHYQQHSEALQEVIGALDGYSANDGYDLTNITHQFTFVHNGDIKNSWLNLYETGLMSNESPGIMPWKSQLIGLTFTNKKASVDVDLDFYVVDAFDGTNPKTKMFSWMLRNCRVANKTDFPDIIFDAGDKLAVFSSDEGKDPKNVVVHMYFRVLSDATEGESIENYSGHIELSGGSGTTTNGA